MGFSKRCAILLIAIGLVSSALAQSGDDVPSWYRPLDPEEEITVGAGPISVPVRMIDFYQAMEQDAVLFVSSLVDLIEMLVGEYGSIQALGFTQDEVDEIRSGMSLVLAHLTPHALQVMPGVSLSKRQIQDIRTGIETLRRHAKTNEIDVDLDALEDAMLGSSADAEL